MAEGDSGTALAASVSSPFSLKTKGGKPFSVFGRLSDERSLHATWRVSNKVAAFLEQGQRIENMAWRLWHVRDVMTTPSSATTATSSRFTLDDDDDQRTFNRVTAGISARMEEDRKRQLKHLTTPEFRWTDEIDALRHRAVMRMRNRDSRAAQKSNDKAETATVKQEDVDVLMNDRKSAKTIRKRGSTSNSPSSLTTTSSKSAPKRKNSSPPVCWRLTQQEHVARLQRQRRRLNSSSSSSSSSEQTSQPQNVRSTWTLQEIEAAEKELKEQGVELSGPLLAMLADLKTGEIAKAPSHDENHHPPLSLPDGDSNSGSNLTQEADGDGSERDAGQEPEKAQDMPEDKDRDRPQCVNCGATSTPLWRRDANFELQCNACGLYEKLHKVPRPRALKKRRNDRRTLKQSPAPSGSSATQDQFGSPSLKADEWIGIHAGATCANCGTSTTPLWRKDSEGRIICNACGLYFKLHNAHRPVTMRMDAIKRRSRCDDRRRFSSQQVNQQSTGITSPNTAENETRALHVADLPSLTAAMVAHSNYAHPSQHPTTPGTPSSLALHHHHHHHPSHGHEHSIHSIAGQQSHQNVLFPTLAHPQQEQQLVGFNTNANQAVLMNNSLSHISGADGDEEIHIPSALWENQVCPMGAWGENCCQNLPQPTIDVSSALLAAAGPSEDLADQAAVNAAMDALLNHGGASGSSTADWIADLTAGHHHHHSNSMGSTAADNMLHAAQFDPTAIVATSTSNTASSPLTTSVVGPSFPIRRRKTQRRPGNAAPPGTPQSQEAAALMDLQSPVTVTGSLRAGSNAGTPVADWWSFATSPADHHKT